MSDNSKVPCTECPFRRVAAPGWLGSWTVVELLHQIAYGPFPCHKTIVGPNMAHDDPRLRPCTGAAIYLNIKMQLSRYSAMANAQHNLKDCGDTLKASVFHTADEFITYHTKRAKQSARG